MAFTSKNDLNIIQASDTPIVGAGAGDDIYILGPATIGSNQSVTITDTQGTNTLQLVGGLTIMSSKVTNDALQLTFSNGAVVSLLHATAFSFDVGGNALTGNPGISKDYAAFAQDILGVAAIPAAGAPAVTTTAQVVIGGVAPPPCPVKTAVTVADLQIYDASTGAFNYLLNYTTAGVKLANINGFGVDDSIQVVTPPAGSSLQLDSSDLTSIDVVYGPGDFSNTWAITMGNLDTPLVSDVVAAGPVIRLRNSC